MTRLRDLGVEIGSLPPGPHNAITDVAGVSVGHSTIVSGHDDPAAEDIVVRSGVTVVRPRTGVVRNHPLFAGAATLNGNGEMTGLEWIRESGLLTTEIGLTGTHSVGVVRDALVTAELRTSSFAHAWSMPVVGETCDLNLSGGGGQHVTASTSSRRIANDLGGWTVGVLVQANHGTRGDFRVDGVPVGRSERFADVPLPGIPDERKDRVSAL